MSARLAVLGAQVFIALAFLAAWQASSGHLIDELLVSSPAAIYARSKVMLANGELFRAMAATIQVVLLGLLIGSIAGVAAGLVVGLNAAIRPASELVVNVLFALPKIALIPLFVLWFGVSRFQRIAFTAVVVFFFLFFAALRGIKHTSGHLDRMMSILGATPGQRLWKLYLPSSVGWFLTGLRIAVPYAFVGAVSAEVVLARDGIGHLVKMSASMMDISGMFVGILTATILAASAGGIVDLVERLSGRFRVE